jgi:hypothetical protein
MKHRCKGIFWCPALCGTLNEFFPSTSLERGQTRYINCESDRTIKHEVRIIGIWAQKRLGHLMDVPEITASILGQF